MAGVNKVILVGNLGKDPEVRHLEGGAAVANFPLATTETYKDKNGNRNEQTEWHNIVVWRELAERAEKQLKKGAPVYVEGKISYRKYTGQDGVEKSVTDIVASMFRSLERKEGSGDSRFPSAEPSTSRSTPASSMPTVEAAAPAEGDDLPF